MTELDDENRFYGKQFFVKNVLRVNFRQSTCRRKTMRSRERIKKNMCYKQTFKRMDACYTCTSVGWQPFEDQFRLFIIIIILYFKQFVPFISRCAYAHQTHFSRTTSVIVGRFILHTTDICDNLIELGNIYFNKSP